MPLDFEWWSRDQITSWMDSLLWVPHHIASLLCCMFAFLLAWIAGATEGRRRAVPILLIACAIASAFGLSVYVTFAFFLLMLAWAVWQIAGGAIAAAGWNSGDGWHACRSPAAALSVGTNAWGLSGARTGSASKDFCAGRARDDSTGVAAENSVFRAPGCGSSVAARNLANLILLAPGYALELGFYLMVLLIFLIPAWRGRTVLNRAQRALVFLALATLPIISFLRSAVIHNNDFGWRAALLLQFPLLLLGSELVTTGD